MQNFRPKHVVTSTNLFILLYRKSFVTASRYLFNLIHINTRLAIQGCMSVPSYHAETSGRYSLKIKSGMYLKLLAKSTRGDLMLSSKKNPEYLLYTIFDIEYLSFYIFLLFDLILYLCFYISENTLLKISRLLLMKKGLARCADTFSFPRNRQYQMFYCF